MKLIYIIIYRVCCVISIIYTSTMIAKLFSLNPGALRLSRIFANVTFCISMQLLADPLL